MDQDAALEELVAQKRIKDLRAAYCYTFDSRDRDAFLSLFTDDAAYNVHGTEYNGIDEIEEFFVENHADREGKIVHFVHNPMIDVTGDSATGKWYFEVRIKEKGSPIEWLYGTYDETYTRTDDGWKFDTVEITMLSASEVPPPE